MRAQRPKKLAFAAMAAILAIVGSGGVTAQSPTDPPAAPSGSLIDRQKAIHDRFTRLESTMLKLTKLLAQTEPEKAERVKDARDLSGKQRIKARAEALVALLKSSKLGDADSEQEKLLTDLDSLLKVLTNPANELDKRREEGQ